MNEKVLVVSNLEPFDETFDSDVGTWNVTRARKDCEAGKHKLFGFCVDDLYSAIKNVEVDKAKVAKFTQRKILNQLPPVLLIEEKGVLWTIDGHHTIRAHKRAGKTRISGYVINEKDSAPYIVWYNGQRTLK